ncbi:MAG: hypothetical protein HKN69_04455 [Desulfofustis sp.]|nr:hypothetical protein [Desulfofustis sp.]
MIDISRLVNITNNRQEWLLKFEVTDLSGLQKVLRHFDKTNLDYEFYLDF